MITLNFKESINATPQKVWQVLWNDATYRKWTTAFHEGSYAVSDWKKGSRVQFLGPNGDGMFSEIADLREHEYMAFRHLGEMKDGKEQPADDKTKSWAGAMETYTLKEENVQTTLSVSLDTVDDYADYFKKAFPEALKLVKQISEQPVMITIESNVNAGVDAAWKMYNTPEHVIQWNSPSEDWHTPRAENDLRKGGSFVYRMEAKDKSMGFDFGGVYDEVITNERIAYTMGDGRKVTVTFQPLGIVTKVTVDFEAETQNPIDFQQQGWQSILNNYKKYTEANS